MFENLEVKDPREASKRFKEALEKEKAKQAEKLNKMEKEHAKRERDLDLAVRRREVRIDELQGLLQAAEQRNEAGVTKAQYEKEYKANKANIAQWEKVFKDNEDKWRSTQARLVSCSAIRTNVLITDIPRLNLTSAHKLIKKNTMSIGRNGWSPTRRTSKLPA